MNGLAITFASVPTRVPGDQDWLPLAYLASYRLVLATLFATLTFSGVAPRPLGDHSPFLFAVVSAGYLVVAIVGAFAAVRRQPAFQTQLVGATSIDICILSVLMFASGGVASGFGLLLVVAVAGGSLLSHGRVAFGFAALASLTVLVQQLMLATGAWVPASDYTNGGMLGLAFFATAALAHLSGQRLRVSEDMAERTAVDLANLAQVNDHIIQRMQSGVLVVDGAYNVRFINSAAEALLGSDVKPGGHLRHYSSEAMALLERWEKDQTMSSYAMSEPANDVSLIISFASIGGRNADGVVVFLEDASAMYQRAQQLKLASLGRLTASIAHEVRNPLAAISHAGELLGEVPTLEAADARLTEIINSNCKRVNEIIESVLELSRRRSPCLERLQLRDWLVDFVKDLDQANNVDIDLLRTDLTVRFDKGQLRQVVGNLVENALRHAGEDARITLSGRLNPDTGRPYLDIVDNGPGFDLEHAEHIFEPFFTTRAEGTGLGLYIARELCEANQASLAWVPATGETRFRLTFSDPRRQGHVQ